MPWIDFEIPIGEDEPTEREKQQVNDFACRKAKPRFYADENFPESAIAILRKFKADVLTVREIGRRGHPDENHAAEALRLGRVLITCDRDYLDDHRFPLIHCPALVVCDFGQGTASEIRATFKCLGGIFSVPQFFDKWTKIDAKRDSWTEYARHLDGTTSRHRYRFQCSRMQEWVD
jgi:predicted nuclease of predicted toxin-antitoxin system